jgi:hypothetical protein
LQVASEDTVLYTARQYLSKLHELQPTQAQHALKVLAPLIRCPQLSRYWMSGAIHAADYGQTMLAELRPQMWQLLLLRDAQEEYVVQDEDLREGQLLAGAPPPQLGAGPLDLQTSAEGAVGLAVGRQRAA